MRIITIDNGNSNPHAGIFENQKLTSVVPLHSFVPLPDDFILASDVGAPLKFPLSFDLKNKRHTKSHPYFFDMNVQYAETLGDDRLICSYYIYKKIKKSGEKVLLIDAGTFITMDIVTSNGFEGGFIFPGIKTYLASYGKGAQLPVLVNETLNLSELPHSTEEAILGAKEIYLDSILKGIVTKTMPSKIFVTGGAGDLIAKNLNELSLEVPLELDPHLIHSALFLIQQSLPHQA